jgi:1,4-dihydroxy-2-naphthoate octaprenyltransferase
MGMSESDKKAIITVLAVIGGLVVLGWLLKIMFGVLPFLILLGIAAAVYYSVKNGQKGQ